MKLDRRITNGLAWAGVVLVVGVPTADLLSAQFSGDGAVPAPQQVAIVSEIAPMPAPLSQRPSAPVTKVAVAEPVAPATAKPDMAFREMSAADIDRFINKGKEMPSYITGVSNPIVKPDPAQVADTAPAGTPLPARTPIVTAPVASSAPVSPVSVDPIQVSAIPPQKIAPMPMPLSMRPAPIRVPIATAAPTTPGDLVIPPGLVPVEPLDTVTSADLDDWESGPLSEYLARQQGRGSSANVTSDYDPDGFFLDQGPNPSRRDRVIGWEDQGSPFFAD
ncbi:MAG: hypothetical protein JWQ22_1649 [Devosia sp.]|nr:hypothetical protein [Devosia sp.]